MEQNHLIEKAYICAKENFKKGSFTFKQLFELLLKKDPSIKNEAADLYIEILQDIRFISLGKQKWALRENFKHAEINKITSSMFGLDEYHEEDADQYMSDVEKSELKKAKSTSEEIGEFLSTDDEDEIDITATRKTSELIEDDEEVDEMDKDSEVVTIVGSEDDEEIEESDDNDELSDMGDDE